MDSDPRVTAMTYGAQTLAETTARLALWTALWDERGLGPWLFRARESALMVGIGGLFPSRFAPPDIELGYVLKHAHWGLGYATEIEQASLGVGFGDLGLARIIAIAARENAASRRVMEKAGMRFERELEGGYGETSVLYAIDRDRWLAGRASG
jgi:RimJ/RimL family protein N-acetyltransferase